MSKITCEYRSAALDKCCRMTVLLPERDNENGKGELPRVLYLLHGLSDDDSIWSRRTNIELYAEKYNIAVVMPDGGRSFYTDAKCGYKYWTWLSEELPQIVCRMFNVSKEAKDTFAAGNSMGGYGSLKLALKRPDRFAGAVGISSVADIANWFTTHFPCQETTHIFGSPEDIIRDGNDLMLLADRTAKLPAPPKIMTICGTEDFLYQDNLKLRDHLRSISFPGYQYIEAPGEHSWSFWDKWIQEALRFLFGN